MEERTIVTLKDVAANDTIKKLIHQANAVMASMGYTEHGQRHVGYVSRTAAMILEKLEYPQRTVELAAIAGWVHDVGNAINRKNHGPSGAAILIPILTQMNMPMDEVITIVSAVGNHEEETGVPVSEVSAALIIADKVDAHRTRVRRGKYNPYDIHDRVNYAISKNWLDVDREKKNICYGVIMDESSSVMDFMQIYMTRMHMCELAAGFLSCTFTIMINDLLINSHKVRPDPMQA